ncbi:MAG: hypothetical protein ACI9MF_000708 [Gammaproteobacteria bacterium]
MGAIVPLMVFCVVVVAVRKPVALLVLKCHLLPG